MVYWQNSDVYTQHAMFGKYFIFDMCDALQDAKRVFQIVVRYANVSMTIPGCRIAAAPGAQPHWLSCQCDQHQFLAAQQQPLGNTLI